MKKTLTIAVAFAATAASTAFAQPVRPHAAQSQLRALNAHVLAYPNSQPRKISRPNDVFDIRGHYIGSDPDPTVRAQMAHDPTGGD
jgi:hypothetical protein